MSPRAAGNDPNYVWHLLDKSTGEYLEDCDISLPSVTTIIKGVLSSPALVPWAYRQTLVGIDILHDHGILNPEEEDLDEVLKRERLRPDDIRDDGATRGTDAHAYLEHLAGVALTEPDEALGLVQAYLTTGDDPFRLAICKWWRDTRPVIVASEARLRSLKHGYAGTCDLVYKKFKEGTPGVCDLKTRKANSGSYRDDKVQVAAYELMYNEMYPDNPVRWKSVLIVMDDGTYKEHESTVDPQVFLDLFHVYVELKGL